MMKISLQKDKGKKLRKKDKGKKFTGQGLKIVDEDNTGFKPESESEEEEVEDLPQIAAVVDERPVEIQALESFNQGKWKRLEDRDNTASSDLSPPRRGQAERKRRDSNDLSPPRRKKQLSPPRRRNSGSDDLSPPRRRGLSSPQSRRHHSDSDDLSPPRRRQESPVRHSDRRGQGERNRKVEHRKYSEDLSPPRRRKQTSPQPRRPDSNSADISPPRRRHLSPARRNDGRSQTERRRRDSDDLSPPRKKHSLPPPNRRNEGRSRERDRNLAKPEILESTDDDGRRKTTLDGKKAGLQKAIALRDEMLDFRKRENELFETLPDEISGRNAKAVVRDRRTEEDLAKEAEKQIKEVERKEKYDKWGKGIKQVEEQEERVRSALHEMAKPLARYKDDDDLDEHLKHQDREGDPMLEYLSAKRRKQKGGVEKPKYNGPPPPPNRFKIPPGFRWDGVDRSNGYEKEWFNRINARKALQEEAYKWSVEDL